MSIHDLNFKKCTHYVCYAESGQSVEMKDAQKGEREKSNTTKMTDARKGGKFH